MIRDYENMVIVRPDLQDQEKEEIFDKISKRISDLGGRVSDSKIWAKERSFYYFLRSRGAQKKKYYKGCYWFIRFNLDTDKILDLKETIRLEERILRNLIVREVKNG